MRKSFTEQFSELIWMPGKDSGGDSLFLLELFSHISKFPCLCPPRSALSHPNWVNLVLGSAALVPPGGTWLCRPSVHPQQVRPALIPAPSPYTSPLL